MKIFCKAKEVLENNGWTQGEFGTKDGPVCLLGAVCLAASDGVASHPGDLEILSYSGGLREPSYRQMRDDYASAVIQLRTKLKGEEPHNWNDRSGRTAEEVKAVLEELCHAV